MTEITDQSTSAGAGDVPPARHHPTRQEGAGLLNGWLRVLGALRPGMRDRSLEYKQARAQADAQHKGDNAVRAGREAKSADRRLSATPPALRPLQPLIAALVTGLLMLGSWFTLSTLLAVANVPEPESWLLPLAIGPVFVLTVKNVVAAWLRRQDQSQLDRIRRGILARFVVPLLLIGVASLVAGVSLKALLADSIDDLTTMAMASSALMFPSLILVEMVGAAALAVRQDMPGAREYQHAAHDARKANRRFRRKTKAAHKAEVRAAGYAALRRARRSYKENRAAAGEVWGRVLKNRAADGQTIDDSIEVGPLTFPSYNVPPHSMRSTDITDAQFDDELRALLRGKDHDQRDGTDR